MGLMRVAEWQTHRETLSPFVGIRADEIENQWCGFKSRLALLLLEWTNIHMYDSEAETRKHIMRVNELLHRVVREFLNRADNHDRSKLGGIEKETFDRVTPRLKTLEYGSNEYKESLKEMGPALEHHYQSNPGHHPEAHENGVDDMNLFDLVEMFIDWKAASERHNTGNINDSITINAKRFKLSEQLEQIFKNTAKYCGWRYPQQIVIDVFLDKGPLSQEHESFIEQIALEHECEWTTNFKPIGEDETIESVRAHMLYNGCHYWQYYTKVDPDHVKQIMDLLSELKQHEYVRNIWCDNKDSEIISSSNNYQRIWPTESKSDPRV